MDTQNIDAEDGLYLVKDGELIRIEQDPDELPKVKITHEVHGRLKELQKSMREVLGGYKPDIVLVASALLYDAVNQDNASETVKRFAKTMFLS